MATELTNDEIRIMIAALRIGGPDASGLTEVAERLIGLQPVLYDVLHVATGRHMSNSYDALLADMVEALYPTVKQQAGAPTSDPFWGTSVPAPVPSHGKTVASSSVKVSPNSKALVRKMLARKGIDADDDELAALLRMGIDGINQALATGQMPTRAAADTPAKPKHDDPFWGTSIRI